MSNEPSHERESSGAAAGLRAIILAGGKGTRLLPFSINFPKPLVPLGDTPVLKVLINRLVRYGIIDITLSLGHLAELIKAYFDQHQSLLKQINLRYVVEEKPIGTAGSLSLVPDLRETFLVMNGDLLTNLDFNALVEFHRAQGAMLTIATHARHFKVDLGIIEFDAQSRITNYLEKPESTYYVSMGIYVYEPTVLRHIPHGQYIDFPDIVLKLLEHGEKVCAYQSDCLWLDIGRPDDYARAQEMFAEKREAFDLV